MSNINHISLGKFLIYFEKIDYIDRISFKYNLEKRADHFEAINYLESLHQIKTKRNFFLNLSFTEK